MQDWSLEELGQRFLSQRHVMGVSPKTVQHYRDTFILLDRFLHSSGRPLNTRSLTSDAMSDFLVWLKETPTRPWRGSTERSPFSINGCWQNCRESSDHRGT